MYKISIIVCIVLMVIFVGMIAWENNEEDQLEEQLDEATANFLRVESKQKPLTIEMAKTDTGEDEILILTREKALELRHKFPVGSYTFIFKDMLWPITQSIAIDRFIKWIYLNDYEIVKKK